MARRPYRTRSGSIARDAGRFLAVAERDEEALDLTAGLNPSSEDNPAWLRDPDSGFERAVAHYAILTRWLGGMCAPENTRYVARKGDEFKQALLNGAYEWLALAALVHLAYIGITCPCLDCEGVAERLRAARSQPG